jgi:hypothetical protein
MNKLVLIVTVIAFIFIVSYDPKKGKKLSEMYQTEPSLATSEPCVESRYLELQGLKGVCSQGHPKEIGGVVFST